MDTYLIDGTYNKYIQEELSILNGNHGTDDKYILFNNYNDKYLFCGEDILFVILVIMDGIEILRSIHCSSYSKLKDKICIFIE